MTVRISALADTNNDINNTIIIIRIGINLKQQLNTYTLHILIIVFNPEKDIVKALTFRLSVIGEI